MKLANLSLVQEAIDVVEIYMDRELTKEEIVKYTYNVIDWYRNTDLVDPDRLAYLAIAGEYDEYKPKDKYELEDIVLRIAMGGVYYVDEELYDRW